MLAASKPDQFGKYEAMTDRRLPVVVIERSE
jgi:hypothetical protein